MILPIDRRASPCFARQSGLRVEITPCDGCTRRCGRNRRALAALLGAARTTTRHATRVGARAGSHVRPEPITTRNFLGGIR